MKNILISVAALCLMSGPAFARAVPHDSSFRIDAMPGKPLSLQLAPAKRELARQLALQHGQNQQLLSSTLKADQLAISLPELLAGVGREQAAFKQLALTIDRNIRVKKGIANYTSDVLQVRLAHSAMLKTWQQGQEPLYAYEPDGDERNWTQIEAFDRHGGVHYLDPHQLPNRPVLVIDLDARKDLTAGIQMMNDQLQRLLPQRQALPKLTASALNAKTSSAQTAALDVGLLERVRLNNDEEPWISGAAEVYAIVTGVDPSRDQPALDIVDMPYLDHDKTTYSPNQVLVYWPRYRWAAVDVLFYEHDDNTNYQQLVSLLFQAASQALNLYGRPDIGALLALGSSIINAMPGSWFTNDDDYIDAFYTLLKHVHYVDHFGASGNVQMSLKPYSINAN